jgi:hypothetical protein
MMEGDSIKTGSRTGTTIRWRGVYRTASLGMAVVFAIVGLLFLTSGSGVLRFFNGLSVGIGLDPSPVDATDFFLVLGVGYMYLVTLLAWLMARHPENRSFPMLLMNAKFASSLLSIAFFFLDHQFLIYVTNGVVDGCIGAFVLVLNRKLARQAA